MPLASIPVLLALYHPRLHALYLFLELALRASFFFR